MIAKLLGTTAILLAACLQPVSAASPDAWAEFAETVDGKCRALAEGEMEIEAVRVDPFCSETYGLAIVSGRVGEAAVERICVMDKQSEEAELGGELPMAAATGDALGFLASEDRADLDTTRAAAERTLAEIESSGEPLDAGAMDAADNALTGLNDTFSAIALAPGAYACTVYWYGFLDQGARRVGDHRCRVSEAETGTIIEKISGERLAANLIVDEDRTVYVGRTFLEGQSENAYDAANPAIAGNSNFGNKVGLAAQLGESVYLISTQARGMQPKDETFFEIIALTPAP